jgi:hypothetical protein
VLAGLALWSAAAQANELTAEEAAPKTHTLKGFDLDVTLTESSGVEFASEAYENVLAVTLDPRFHLGTQLFKGGWAEPLSLSASLTIDGELSGNSGSYRGASFATPALRRDAPETVQFAQAAQDAAATPANSVDGTNRRALVSDLRLSVSHEKLLTIPWVGVQVAASARVVLPTSSYSRNIGLRAAPSLSAGLHRTLGPVELRWDIRGTYFFVASTTAPVVGPAGTVSVGGLDVTPERFASTGSPNSSHALVNTVAVSVELPANFSVAAEYSLSNLWKQPLGACAVPGVPTADVCTSGQQLGMVQSLGQSDSQSFWLEAGWKLNAWGSLGLGLSTMRPVRAPNGLIANPFLQVNRDNYSSIYLSLYVNAEALASALHPAAAAPK